MGFLNKNDSIEIMLDNINYQAWEQFDDFSSENSEDNKSFYKVATYMEDDQNILILHEDHSDELYKVNFVYNSDTQEVTFGELEKVEAGYLESRVEGALSELSVKNYVNKNYDNPLVDIVTYKHMYGEYPEIKGVLKNKKLTGVIVSKEIDNEKRIVEGAVLIPDEADYDGDVVGKEKIEEVAHDWMLKYRNADLQHTLNNVANPVESYILKEERSITNVDGDSYTLPVGSWILAVKVEDDDTWESVKNGELTGFSMMAVPKVTKSRVEKKTTLADIENAGHDWTVNFVSLVDEPAVPKGKYYALKSKGTDKSTEQVTNKSTETEEGNTENTETVKKGIFEKLKDMLTIKNDTTPESYIAINGSKFTIKEGRTLSTRNVEKLKNVLVDVADVLQDADVELVQVDEEGNNTIINIGEITKNKEDEVNMDKNELMDALKELKEDILNEVDNKLSEVNKSEDTDNTDAETDEEVVKNNTDNETTEETTETETETEDITKEDIEALKSKIDELTNELESVKSEKGELEDVLTTIKSKFKTTKSNVIEGQDGDEESTSTTMKRYEGRDQHGRKIVR